METQGERMLLVSLKTFSYLQKYKLELKALRSKNDPKGSSSKSPHSELSVVDINSYDCTVTLGSQARRGLGIRLVGLDLTQVFLADKAVVFGLPKSSVSI